MFKYVGSYLNTVEEVQPPPLHSQLGEAWWSTVNKDWESYLKEAELSDSTLRQARDVLECYEIGYACLAKAANQKEQSEVETETQIQALLEKPQSVQRTEEWYREMKEVLSASEFYQLFGPLRARGQLVMSKIIPPEDPEVSSSQRKCCLTMEMTPMDWGIRFEPVAKQILENKWKAKIAEMGRLHHPTRKGLAASPDGLIQESGIAELVGDLVEIKCPSSRPIGKLVPPSYWYQMQLQLEVTGRHMCQYCEFNFKSYTTQKPNTCDEPAAPCEKGLVYIIQNEDLQKMTYVYGPLGDMNWKPELEQGWEVVERIPWYLEKYWIQPVVRDEAWFQSILPFIDQFWEDVSKARKGEFQVPDSSVKKKPVACAILD